MKNTENKLLNLISQTIFDKKGFNILCLDVRGISTMTDYYVIAEGNIDRHVKAIGLAIKDVLSEFGENPLHVEGDKSGDWLVLDYGDIVIHLFQPDIREKYSLEQLWKEAKIIDVEIKVKQDFYG